MSKTCQYFSTAFESISFEEVFGVKFIRAFEMDVREYNKNNIFILQYAVLV